MANSPILIVTLITLGFSIGGCGKNKFPSGHYEGNLLQKGSAIAVLPVSIDFSFSKRKLGQSGQRGDIRITDQRGQLISEYQVSASTRKEFSLSIPELRSEAFHLKETAPRIQDGFTTCYLERNEWEAEFCYDGIQFRLRILNQDKVGVLKLIGNTFDKEPEFPLEPPTLLSVQDAVHRALESNLDTRIGFEHVIQAKQSVTAAYLNLIPHLTTNLIWNADPGFISAIATLQGLAPFVLPTYWLQAKESSWDLKVKRDADLILKADLASMVEQLSYAIDRDQKIMMIQDRTLKEISKFQEKVRGLELAGQIQIGSAESIEPLLIRIHNDLEKSKDLVMSDRYVISQALGFHNPEAVSGITLAAAPTPSGDKIEKVAFAALVSQRSFELQQLDYLKEIAKLKKVELYFAWIDPTGDPKSSFGFNTIPQLKVAKSQIKELELKREQLKIAVYQNAYRIADEYNSTLGWFSSRASDIENAVLVSIENDLNTFLTSDRFDRDSVFSVVTDSLSAEIGKAANLAAYRIAQSKVDRAILAGYYENILPHTGEIGIDPGLPMKGDQIRL